MRIGIVGLGIMGQAMAGRLLAQGQEVVVHNRTREKAESLLAQGALWADTPREAAAQSEVVISLVTDPAAVAQVSGGPDGIRAGLGEGAVHCDMSTVAPESARELAAEYAGAGKGFVQAPVLGSKRQIETGTLLVFGGGADKHLQRCEPAWAFFAARTWRFGSASEAATAKLACNLLIGHTIVGLGQSLLLAQAGGVPPETLLEILGASAMGCATFASKGPKLLARDFDANFVVRNMLKDLTLVADAARQTGVPLPVGAVTRELFVAADCAGWGQEDYSAVVKVLETLAGRTLGDDSHAT